MILLLISALCYIFGQDMNSKLRGAEDHLHKMDKFVENLQSLDASLRNNLCPTSSNLQFLQSCCEDREEKRVECLNLQTCFDETQEITKCLTFYVNIKLQQALNEWQQVIPKELKIQLQRLRTKIHYELEPQYTKL